MKFCLIFIGYFISLFQFEIDRNISLHITGFTPQAGKILVSVYEKHEDFLSLDKKFLTAWNVPKNSKAAKINLKIAKGTKTIAIAVFQDLNNNGKLDTNSFGIPIEPYGFSNGFDKKWSKPAFDNVAMHVKYGKTYPIELKVW